jgi:hypothetical protein
MPSPASERTVLFRFYDKTGTLLYADVTSAADMALFPAPATWPWWPQVTRATACWYPTRASALEAEENAIRGERPVHNQLKTCALPACGATFYRGENGYADALYCTSTHKNTAAQARWRQRQREKRNP